MGSDVNDVTSSDNPAWDIQRLHNAILQSPHRQRNHGRLRRRLRREGVTHPACPRSVRDNINVQTLVAELKPAALAKYKRAASDAILARQQLIRKLNNELRYLFRHRDADERHNIWTKVLKELKGRGISNASINVLVLQRYSDSDLAQQLRPVTWDYLLEVLRAAQRVRKRHERQHKHTPDNHVRLGDLNIKTALIDIKQSFDNRKYLQDEALTGLSDNDIAALTGFDPRVDELHDQDLEQGLENILEMLRGDLTLGARRLRQSLWGVTNDRIARWEMYADRTPITPEELRKRTASVRRSAIRKMEELFGRPRL